MFSKKNLVMLIVIMMSFIIGWDIYAQTSGIDDSGNYIISLADGENIQNALDNLKLDDETIKNSNRIIVELNGNYTNQQVNININKPITIKSKNAGKQANLGLGKITISSGATDVSLKDLFFYGMVGSTSHEFVVVDEKVNLTIDNVSIQHASRPPAGVTDEHLVVMRFTENAAGTHANISNSTLTTNFRCIGIKGSNYDITIDNTFLAGNPAIIMESGENNSVTIRNNSTIEAGSNWGDTPNIEAISFKGQEKLTVNISDSTVVNGDRSKQNHLFSFDDANNKNCVVNITGTSKIVDENTNANSKIFDYELDVPSNNNVFNIDETVSITPDDTTEKYSSSGSSHIVGIHYDNGKTIIKIYDNGSTLPEDSLKLKNSNYTLKGWYKNKDLTDLFENTSSVVSDMDLYPKYTYPVSVKVQGLDDTFTMQSDETLEILKSKYSTNLNSIINPGNKEFNHFEDDKGNVIDDDYVFTKDITLIPIYNIFITYKSEKFTLEVGQSLSDLDKLNSEKLEEAVKVDGKDFSHFVVYGTDTLVDDNYKFSENTTLDAKYTINVTIGKEIFKINDGESLSSLIGEDLDRFNEIKNVKNKEFKQFEIKGEGTKVDEKTTFDKHTELVAKYNVKITFKGSELSLLLDEGKTLKDLKDTYSSDLSNITSVENKQFSYFVVAGSKIEDSYQFNENTELECKYTVIVRVKKSLDTYITISDVPEGMTLEEFLSKYSDELIEVTNNKKKDLKSLLVDDVAIDNDYKFNVNTEVIPKYTINVTFDDKLVVVLDEGETLENLSESDKQKLDNLKKEFGETFDHFENSDGITVDMTEPLNEHTKLYLKYNLTIKIGSETLTLPLNKTISELSSFDKAKLLSIMNVAGKNFIEFKIKGSNEVITKDQLSSYVFDKSVELIPVYDLTITIDKLTFTVSENSTLNDLTKEDKDKIQDIIKASKKTFKNYQIKDGEIIDENYKFTKSTELVINYQITITVKGVEFIIDDNAKLSNLSSEDSDKLYEMVKEDDKIFKQFKDVEGNIVDDDYIFTSNTTLVPYYQVEIKIGDEIFYLDEGQTLRDLSLEGQNALAKIKEHDSKVFNRFTDQNGNVIDLDSKFERNTTIISKFDITVTVDGEEFIIGEDQSLSDLSPSEAERLQNLINPGKNQEFDYYYNVDTGEKVDLNTKFSDNVELKIVYKDIKKGNASVPKTYDDILTYVFGAAVSTVALVGSIFVIKKRKKS